jgi:hypothetical protein
MALQPNTPLRYVKAIRYESMTDLLTHFRQLLERENGKPINAIQALRSPKLAERVYANEWQFILFKPDAERLASHFTGDHAKHCSQCAAYANYQSTSR